MADHEIRIHPTVNLQEIKDLERHLDLVRQQMDRIAGSAAKITIPGTSGAGAKTGPSSSRGGGPSFVSPRDEGVTVQQAVQQNVSRRTGGAQRVNQAQQQAQQARSRGKGRRGGTSTSNTESAQTPGGLLNWMMSVFLPDQPTIQEMTGGASGLNMSKLSPSLRAKMPTFQYNPGAWKSKPQTAEDYQNAAASIPGLDTMSPAQQKAAMDAAMGGYTPVDMTKLSAQRARNHQALYQAYRQGGSGGGAGSGGGGIGKGPQALLDAAGIGGVTKLLGTLGPWGAAAMGVGYVGSQGVQGWNNYRTQGTAFSAISKSVGDLGESFNTLRNKVNATGVQFAESMATLTQVAQTYIPFVGDLSTKSLTGALTASQGLAFSYGLNPTSTTQAFGQAAQMGITPTGGSAGQMTAPQWASLIANATSQGNMQGRTGQVLASMLSVSQNIAQQIAGTPNQNALAAIMTGLNQSGNAMLQGTNGASIMNNLNSGITNPGSGAAGELFTLNAINPGRKLSYYQARDLQAQGLTGINPYTHNTNFAAELQSMYKMLPGGKVTGSTINGQWEPSVQTSGVAGILAPVMHLTQPQMINVLKAFQGKSLSSMNQTEILANQLGGSNALPTLLKKGGINVFGQIANATNVHQLTAAAHDVTGSLHGTVSKAFYTAQKQYEALGKIHPTSSKQATDIAHQRAVDFNKMKDSLGKSVIAGPSLMNSMDKLNQTIAATQKNWSIIASKLVPVAYDLSKIAKAISTPGQTLKDLVTLHSAGPDLTGGVGGLVSKGIESLINQMFGTHLKYSPAKTSAYTPWIGTRSAASPAAQLADFVMGNMASSDGVPIQGGGSNSSNAILASMNISGQGTPLGSGITRWGKNITQDIHGLAGHSPLLTPALVKAVMHQESGGQQYGPNGSVLTSSAGALGLMQLEPGTASSLGVNPNNAQQNLAGGIMYLNQQLQKFGNVAQALSAYNAGPGAVPSSGIAPSTAQYVQDILNELKYLNSQIGNGGIKLQQA